MAAAKTLLYEEVINITQAYFGPAAHRFVNRQIVNHLDKDPEQLTRQDLSNLIDWIAAAMALLAEDPEVVGGYVAELRSLAGIS